MPSEEEFEQIYTLYRKQLQRFVGNYVPSSDIEDVIQDAFMRAWEKRSQFKGNSSLRNWIYRIARNQAISLQRKHRRRPLLLDVEPRITDRITEQDLCFAAMAIALRQNTKPEIITHWLAEYTIEESAEELGCGRGSIVYGRRKIREAAKPYEKRLFGD